MQYAFGETLLCDTTEIAKDICFIRNEPVKAVSLDGTLIHKSGLMTGGSSDIAIKAKRWEEKEITALARSREQTSGDLQEAERQLKRVQADHEVTSEIELLRANITTINSDLAATNKKLQEDGKELKSADTSIASAQQELKTLDTAITPVSDTIRTLEVKIGAVEDRLFRGGRQPRLESFHGNLFYSFPQIFARRFAWPPSASTSRAALRPSRN